LELSRSDTRLPQSLPAQRIAEVAHRYNSQFEYTREYRARGFSDEEIQAGEDLGRAEREEYSINCQTYGRPEYGSRSERMQEPLRLMIKRMHQGDGAEYEAFAENPKAACEWWESRSEAQRKAEYPPRRWNAIDPRQAGCTSIRTPG
jgi:hypothetical protein